jgi:hypothetical protein
MKFNKLSVNINKMNYILFNSKEKSKKNYKNISIIFDKTQLVQKKYYIFRSCYWWKPFLEII